jgi:hypothetical protein
MKTEEQKEEKILKVAMQFKYPRVKYKTNCVFCSREFITEKDTANEQVCYECRCC